MKRLAIGLFVLIVSSIASSTSARADEEDATVADGDDAGIAIEAGDQEEPVGLQPTVFDSNLGCNIADQPSPGSGLILVGALTLVIALVSRRLQRGDR